MTNNMSKLPSERVRELYQEQVKLKPELRGVDLITWAIVEYLDEQYEQQKPCEHSNKTLSHVTGKLTCDKCKEEVEL